MMPSIAQAPLTNGADLIHKEKAIDTNAYATSSGFTAVNGRTSGSPPRSAPQTNGSHGTYHTARSNSLPNSEGDERPAVKGSDTTQTAWTFTNGFASHRASQATNDTEDNSSSTHKRKRSGTDDTSFTGAAVSSEQARRKVDGYESSISPRSPRSTNNLSSIPHSAPHSGTTGYGSGPWLDRERPDTLASESRMAESQDRMHSPTQRSVDYENGDDSVTQDHNEPSSTTELTRAGVQVDPKKRKRQFANRTKTGCQTCRRRKKKCDEAKPECSNCIRGGFVCEGYHQLKSQGPRPSTSRGPMPIQAKDEYNPTSVFRPHVPREQHEATYNEGNRGRPIVVDDNNNSNAAARQPWSSWPEPHSRSHTHPPPPATYAEASHDPRATTKQYYDAPPLAPQQRPPPNQQYGHPPPSMHQSASTVAQMALQHTSSTSHYQPPARQQPPPPPPLESEKSKMLKGEPYLLFAPQLVDEREQCKSALWRFNNAQNPAMGVSREERVRQFRAIMDSPNTRREEQPRGSVGKDVQVEAPFNCEYGYNIHIADNVVIGSNCTILDPCQITIGARSVIGPNVNILGNTVAVHPRDRAGSKGTAIGVVIRIEEDCFIGANVTIVARKGKPITIGKGTTIGAGSVVCKTFPKYTVVAGNPAQVLRGVWDPDERGRP
ncbi:trimeric LpxA-like protein [Pseudovirgaria hyperparasitica]|uniref:Trimeric LpxA-like protein n=1 Tax=Pseudovirgaria hyperparasitica TaxID=470096 RepID=A0A6A6WBX0_9PEZI|nr:trimeric LpxA-like protein [Pseudovirgaria hyperparasitica]KAF2759659.1 trimeric LpxA-like protein [Pseudovirgaria hyperparasitica]